MGSGDRSSEGDLRENLSVEELRHIAYEQLGVRVAASLSTDDIHDLLQYKTYPNQLPDNPVNQLRDRIIAFVDNHKGQLSLPCSGNCYEHSDAVVVTCYRELVRDTDGKIDEEDV